MLNKTINRNNIYRLAGWLWLSFTLAYIFFKGIVPGWNNRTADFNNYYVSARLFVEGESLSSFYDNAWFSEKAKTMGIEAGGKFSPFPPVTALLALPLSGFEVMTAKRIWVVMCLLMLMVIPFRLRYYFGGSLFSNALWVSLFFTPLANNINFGQAYLFPVLLLLESVGQAVFGERISWPTIWITFCAMLKYFPLLYLGYLIKNKTQSGRIIFYFLLIIFGVAGFLVLWDKDVCSQYFSVLTGHMRGDLSGQGKFAVAFQSLDSLFNNLFVYDPVANLHPIARLPVLKPLLTALFWLFVSGISFILLKRENYTFSTQTVSVLLFGGFVIIPASASYHFLFLIIPVVLIGKWIWQLPGFHHRIIFIALLLFTFSVQYHHAPSFKSVQVINMLIHYPRLFGIVASFSYLSYLRFRFSNN